MPLVPLSLPPDRSAMQLKLRRRFRLAGAWLALCPALAFAADRTPGHIFTDPLTSGGTGPKMVVVPAGSFRMGCREDTFETLDDYKDWDINIHCRENEKPVHRVTIARPFAVSVYEVTFEDYDRFRPGNEVDDQGWGRGTRPVINVSWYDAWDYIDWLSAQTGATYRLLSEAEWEYAARAGTSSKYVWGDEIGYQLANCNASCGDRFRNTAPVGRFPANAFGLYDMHGNVEEWVDDCWNRNYEGAPSDGSIWRGGSCGMRVARGGSWYHVSWIMQSETRVSRATGLRSHHIGFRVARTLSP